MEQIAFSIASKASTYSLYFTLQSNNPTQIISFSCPSCSDCLTIEVHLKGLRKKVPKRPRKSSCEVVLDGEPVNPQTTFMDSNDFEWPYEEDESNLAGDTGGAEKKVEEPKKKVPEETPTQNPKKTLPAEEATEPPRSAWDIGNIGGWNCPICDLSFHNKRQLRSHQVKGSKCAMEMKRRGIARSDLEGKCPYCRRVFKSARLLTLHCTRLHGYIPPRDISLT